MTKTTPSSPSASVLVFNAGSSSLKFQLLEPEAGAVTARGIVERIGARRGAAHITGPDSATASSDAAVPNYDAALAVTTGLFDEIGVPLQEAHLTAVGHRVVHGGTDFREPTVITAEVLDTIRDLIPLAPLHNPANAGVIASALGVFPKVPQVAVFDTAFFADLPAVARTYAIDRETARQNRIQRYGFHGISHEYVAQVAAELVDRPYTALRQIVLHLGNGASASAIHGGRAVDTSMGMTPLEGLVMGTRGGDIDPGVLIHLQRTAGMSANDLDDLLNRHSGMFGLAGAIDLRDIHASAAAGDAEARLALELYAYRIRKYVGAYMAVLGGVDVVTFTAGVGENDGAIRAAAVQGLGGWGIAIDPDRNAATGRGARVISPDGARATVCVIPTNEELAIARQAAALV